MNTSNDIVTRIPKIHCEELPAPQYLGACGTPLVGMCVPSMAKHTTDEGWQLFQALEVGGYELTGYGLGAGVNTQDILSNYQPGTIVLQDKREWEGLTAGKGFDRREMFTNVSLLKDKPDIFKLTVLKDAQNQLAYHGLSAEEIGCHGWIIYYHPKIVKHLAPFIREQHLVRTYHTINPEIVPKYTDRDRHNKALLSGALSAAYPLRQHIHKFRPGNVDYRMHPGYGRTRCDTPGYLKALSHYKVAICTTSRYGYALRKIIEATACGCRVITDLPVDDVLPEIDGNLTRVNSVLTATQIKQLVDSLVSTYDSIDQYNWSEAAKTYYDYRVMGVKLAYDIETLRQRYNQ